MNNKSGLFKISLRLKGRKCHSIIGKKDLIAEVRKSLKLGNVRARVKLLKNKRKGVIKQWWISQPHLLKRLMWEVNYQDRSPISQMTLRCCQYLLISLKSKEDLSVNLPKTFPLLAKHQKNQTTLQEIW